VHTAAVHLAPILGAEKSKVPFYIAGGILVVWAMTLSLLLGLRKPDFPGNLVGQRVVGAISAVLVLAAVSTAVITSGGGTEKAGAASGSSTQTAAAQETPSPPAESTPSSSTPARSTPTGSPIATTGTPAPPSSPAAKASAPLKLAANPAGQLSFDVKQLSAKAGQVRIDFANASPIEHNVTIAQGSTVLGATPTFTGGSKTLTLKLKPGTYTFFCSVPGHRQAGMEGTLKVS
jgi:plastocyanin